ncbi:MAG: YdcF family protein [Microcoleaceae cyanobacterium]
MKFRVQSLARLFPQLSIRQRRRLRRFAVVGCMVILLLLLVRLGKQVLTLQSAAQQPVDLLLVLGGSINREIYASEQAKQLPSLPVLISTGSDDPCIVELFRRIQAPVNQIWLEKCADSTFGNFFFSQPILSRWGIRHVELITSPSHLPRAQWMAKIMLGAHGIWVDTKLVGEPGVPGNRESPIKTALDTTRAMGWALASQVFQPSCTDVIRLSEVDFNEWCEMGIKCERQAGIDVEALCE